MKIDISYNSNYFWRVVFTVMVILLHSNYLSITNNGWYLAVEYFFIISGFWLVHSYEQKKKSTTEYIVSRVCKLYPHQLLSFVVLFVWYYRSVIREGNWSEVFRNFTLHLGEALPFTYFFSDYEYTGVQFLNYSIWYISVLLLVSLVFYFILSKYKEFFLSLLAPVLVLLIYRYFYHHCMSLNTGNDVGIFLNEFYLRGFAGMACGCIIYCIVQKLSEITFNKKFYVVARCVELISFGGGIYLSHYYSNSKNDVYLVMLLCVGVICSFLYTKKTVLSGRGMKYLNGLMYPVYLNHLFVIYILDGVEIIKNNNYIRIVALLILVGLYSIFTQWIVNKGIKILKKIKGRLIVANTTE